MGIIAILLIDENGNEQAAVSGNPHSLDRALAHCDGPDYQCLRFIDPYDDTCFNRLQLSQLLVEWDAVEKRLTDPEALAVAVEVRDLIKRGLAAPHTYLEFYGD